MRLYSTAKPHCNTAGFGDPSVRALLGIATPMRPVTASGLSNDHFCGKSPKPFPKNSPGVHVLNVSAPASLLRVLPPSGVTMRETVGSENSSATNGSSVESVAGKNLLPAKPCAEAVLGADNIIVREDVPVVRAALLISRRIRWEKLRFMCGT